MQLLIRQGKVNMDNKMFGTDKDEDRNLPDYYMKGSLQQIDFKKYVFGQVSPNKMFLWYWEKGKEECDNLFSF